VPDVGCVSRCASDERAGGTTMARRRGNRKRSRSRLWTTARPWGANGAIVDNSALNSGYERKLAVRRAILDVGVPLARGLFRTLSVAAGTASRRAQRRGGHSIQRARVRRARVRRGAGARPGRGPEATGAGTGSFPRGGTAVVGLPGNANGGSPEPVHRNPESGAANPRPVNGVRPCWAGAPEIKYGPRRGEAGAVGRFSPGGSS
jgi:hypothetical protein